MREPTAIASPLRAAAFAGALFAMSLPVPTSAGTLNLRWNACFGDGGVANRNFACDTNSGSQSLVGSFVLPFDVSFVIGNDIVVDVGTAGATLPAWWDFKNAGTCRQTSLSANLVVPATAVQCTNWTDGSAVILLASYTEGTFGPSSARIRVASAMPRTGVDLFANTEFFSFSLLINNVKTVGACAGCSVGACINLRALDVKRAVSLTDDVHLFPSNVSDALVTWQGGSGVITGNGCPAATPTRDRTWGAVKALYR